MENRNLGRGRISVPVVGLGTWQRLEAAAAAGQQRELIEAAIATGIRLIDTSPMYGAAERLLAGALNGQRGQVLITNKVWIPSVGGGCGATVPRGGLVRRPGRPDADPQPGGLARAPGDA